VEKPITTEQRRESPVTRPRDNLVIWRDFPGTHGLFGPTSWPKAFHPLIGGPSPSELPEFTFATQDLPVTATNPKPAEMNIRQKGE
jgi:hypothetical protein